MRATSHLPRVTYTNMPSDLEPVHQWFDEALPEFRAGLGQIWPNIIAGRADDDGVRYESVSPVDSSIVLGTFTDASDAAVDRAVAAAGAADAWSRVPWRERLAILRNLAQRLDEAKYELALAILYEVGKTRLEALGEAEEAVGLIQYYCDELERKEGFVSPAWRSQGEQSQTHLRPVGVFAVIAPFNYPVALAINMISAALVAGNRVVFKPSPHAGLTASMLARVIGLSNLPAGTFNLVCGESAGRALARHPAVDGIAFTGSNAVGTALFRQMAARDYMRPVLAEMGGKNVAYVAKSADIAEAVEGVARSAFNMQGQKCTACSIALVHESLFDDFVSRLVERAGKARIGNVEQRDVSNGPLINERSMSRYLGAAREARSAGKLRLGGDRLIGGVFDKGQYAPPAVAVGLPPEHPLYAQELFAPFLLVDKFSSLRDAIARGNSAPFGLASGFYGRDAGEVATYLEQAETGVQYVNRLTGATTGAWPGIQSFCGWKGSGLTGKGGLGPHYLPQFMREQSRTVRVLA